MAQNPQPEGIRKSETVELRKSDFLGHYDDHRAAQRRSASYTKDDPHIALESLSDTEITLRYAQDTVYGPHRSRDDIKAATQVPPRQSQTCLKRARVAPPSLPTCGPKVAPRWLRFIP